MKKIITFTSDFGLRDSYVAQVKGVLHSMLESVEIVDLSHDISPGNVYEAARFLEQAIWNFLADSIHLCVVDPGVGGKRRRLVLEANVVDAKSNAEKKMTFVGPDNGLFSFVAPVAQRISAWEISADFFDKQKRIGTTFEGRDIFGVAAARLALGIHKKTIAQEIEPSSLIELLRPVPHKTDKGFVGQIEYLDRFGNAISNLKSGEHFQKGDKVSFHEKELLWVNAYEEIKPETIGVLVNSEGRLELASFNTKAPNTKPGDRIDVESPPPKEAA